MKAVTSFALVILFAAISIDAKKKSCEVCISVLQKVLNDMEKGDQTKQDKLDDKIKEFCGGSKGKDQRFCYYIGALPESATYIMNEVTKPLSWSMPPEKVCERLHEKDSEICNLEYDKAIDWTKVDVATLPVKELRKVLDSWGEVCKGCKEKSEFVQRVRELMPQFVPAKTEL